MMKPRNVVRRFYSSTLPVAGAVYVGSAGVAQLWAAAATFTVTDATGTIANAQTSALTIGLAMLVLALVVRGFAALRKA